LTSRTIGARRRIPTSGLAAFQNKGTFTMRTLLLGAAAAALIAGPVLADVVKINPSNKSSVEVNKRGNTVIHDRKTDTTTKIRTTPDGSTKIIQKEDGNKTSVKVQ
jgi:hypothetical protein